MSTMSGLLVLLSLALVPLPSDSIEHLKVNLLDHLRPQTRACAS